MGRKSKAGQNDTATIATKISKDNKENNNSNSNYYKNYNSKEINNKIQTERLRKH